MFVKTFPVIDPVATGANILRLRRERGLTVRDLQSYFGFEEPRAIYKWQSGQSLPTVDNLYALGALLEVPMEEILIPMQTKLNILASEQQAAACCSNLWIGSFGYGRHPSSHPPIFESCGLSGFRRETGRTQASEWLLGKTGSHGLCRSCLS